MATLYDYIEKLWDDFGVEAALPHESAREYVVPVEDGITVAVHDVKGRGYYLYADICELPDGDKEAFFTHAMSGNLFGQGTDGAVIGLDPDETTLVISRLMSYSITYQQFLDAFEDFCNMVTIWRDEAQEKIVQGSSAKQFF